MHISLFHIHVVGLHILESALVIVESHYTITASETQDSWVNNPSIELDGRYRFTMITVQRPLYNQRVLTPKFYCLGAFPLRGTVLLRQQFDALPSCF